MLAEPNVRSLLKDNFLVAVDTHSRHNATSFGVMTWIYDPDGNEVESYWYGTGNQIIAMRPGRDEERRLALHQKQTNDLVHALEWSLAKAKHIARGNDDAILAKLLDDVRIERPFRGHPLDRLLKWSLRKHALGQKLEQEVTLQDAARLRCSAMIEAFRTAGFDVVTDMNAEQLAGPGVRYSSRPVANSGWTWLARLHRHGVHVYVRAGKQLVFTNRLENAIRNYELELAARVKRTPAKSAR